MENMTTPAVHHDDDKDDYYISIRVMSVVIYSVVLVLGVLGNGVVIWATGFRMKKTVSTVWYLNLAVADFLVTAFLPLVITSRALDRHWPFGWFMCKMNDLVFSMNMYASIYTLVVISVDRCVCVVHPVWTRNHCTVRKASWVSLGVWVLALALSIPHFIFTYTETSHDWVWCHNDYTSTTTGAITNFLVGFLVPFSVIVSCYSVIIYRIRNNRSLASRSGRSFKIIAAVIAAFFLCWLPFHIILCLRTDVSHRTEYSLVHRRLYIRHHRRGTVYSVTLDHVLHFGYPITHALALLNSCVNPLLYVFSQGFKDVFRSRSILKVLEKAFAEEPPQTNTPTDPAVTSPMTTLSAIEGSTGPPGTQDPRP